MVGVADAFNRIYTQLLAHYGPQHWWPGDSRFEIMVGAILTQNTAWQNVETALDQLRQHHCLQAEALLDVDLERLATWIRSAGYFNQKAARLQGFARWYLAQGGHKGLASCDYGELRKELLSVHGIGDETADAMLLYAFDRPSFVIDAYTRRIFSRLQLLPATASYQALQREFHDHLDEDVGMFQQYHALIVAHAKQHCHNKPRCEGCPLGLSCHYEAQQKDK